MENKEFLKENLSISEAVLDEAQKNLNRTAIKYFSRKISYKTFIRKVKKLSLAFYSLGVRRGEVVLVALPNIPQAVYTLYALNRIGAVPAFVSPLSAEYELEMYIDKCKPALIIALDNLYEKLKNAFARTGNKKLVITSVFDELGLHFKAKKENAVLWTELLKLKSSANIYLNPLKSNDTAVILFSGGTTGNPKAVELTNLNLNALASGTEGVCKDEVTNAKMLSVLPMFHGFGLGICIHTVLYFGGECILVPRFDSEKVARIIKRNKPHYVAAVPAMFNPLMKSKSLAKSDLSELKGVFSGGDSLSAELEKCFNEFLSCHNSKIKVRQGYGLTECVAASCLMPADRFKAESVGKPYPDTCYKIVESDTLKEVPEGETGEICIRSKTVMKGYLDDVTETKNVLKKHSDGTVWLHTGDMGCMDNEGFVYFKGRLKRIIVTNGHNVYPSEIEMVISKHPCVKECCVVGVKDLRKVQAVALFLVLNNRKYKTEEIKAEILKYLERYISKQSMPKYIWFLESIPKTALGKTAFSELEKLAEEIVV